MNRPTALIFDWDNTLVDTWPTIHDALNTMLPQMGHEAWTLSETKQRVRLPPPPWHRWWIRRRR